MAVFDYRRNRREQLVKKGEPVDNNVDFSGRTNTDFMNKFVAKMKDTNNLYTRESPGQFDDKQADIVKRDEEEKPNERNILDYIEKDPKAPPVNGQFPTDGVKVT